MLPAHMFNIYEPMTKASECFIGDGRMNEQPNVRIAVNSRSFRA